MPAKTLSEEKSGEFPHSLGSTRSFDDFCQMTAFLRQAAIIPLDLCAKESGTVCVATHLALCAAFSAWASGLCSVAGSFPTCLNNMEKTYD